MLLYTATGEIAIYETWGSVENIHDLRELEDGRVVYQGDTSEDGCSEEKHSYYSYISM